VLDQAAEEVDGKLDEVADERVDEVEEGQETLPSLSGNTFSVKQVPALKRLPATTSRLAGGAVMI
jgi:hypothetical protein